MRAAATLARNCAAASVPVRMRAAATLAIMAFLCTGCGQKSSVAQNPNAGPSLPSSPALQAHPQAVEPVAGAAAPSGGGPGGLPSAVSVGPSSGPLPQPVSDAEIRRELAASGLTANATQATLTRSGLAIAPVGAPAVVQEIIAAGNQIAHLPYRFGGGHGTFFDNAYDCSGSLSFVFAAAGILNTTVTSGQLMSWGAPGAGRWITVFANNGHTFMYVAGLRFDTVALAETGTRWSNRPADEPDIASFVTRHPAGL
jgi:cell wall-associated NlpC family hydrolase